LDLRGDLDETSALAIDMANFNRQQQIIISQPEFSRVVARCAQMHGAQRACRNFDFLVADKFEPV